MNNYNGNTKEFLLKLCLLFEEYQVEMNVSVYSDASPKGVELTVPNPVSFSDHYDAWVSENPTITHICPPHFYADFVDIGNWNDAKALREYLK